MDDTQDKGLIQSLPSSLTFTYLHIKEKKLPFLSSQTLQARTQQDST